MGNVTDPELVARRFADGGGGEAVSVGGPGGVGQQDHITSL